MSILLKHVSRHCRRAYHPRNASFRLLSSQPNQAEKVDVEKKEEKLEIDMKKFSLTSRVVNKQPALPPVIKEMFLGELDDKYLPFMEVIEKEHVDKYFATRRTKAQEFLSQTEDPDRCVNNLKSLGNLSYTVPQAFNGHGYELSETTLHSEIEANNLQANSIINNHRLVIQAITDYGTEQQKSKYLPRLANGELIGTVAIFECGETPDDRPFQSLATPTADGYVLNGEKDFVFNAEKSNLFLVLASSIKQDHARKQSHGITAFIVEENDPGLLRGEPIKTIGCDEVEKYTMTFAKVPLRPDRILGEVNEIADVAMKLMQISRLQSAVTANQIMKQVVNHFSQYCTETKILGGYPKDLEMPQVRLGRMASKTYALESMIYFTTQLVDAYEKQDVDLEIAATKLYAMQNLIEISLYPFHTIGPKSTLSEEITSKNLRDAIQILGQGDTLDGIKLHIGLKAIHHCAEVLADFVNEKRNPMMHPNGFFKNLFSGGPFENIKITKNFIHYLHPSLKPAAEMLEISLKRLQIAFQISLQRNAKEIVLAHAELERLANCATQLYAMLTTISRASRSYCIGTRYADVEIVLANTFAMESLNQIIIWTEQINAGENMSNDINHMTIAKQVFDSKGYFCENPLKREF